MERWPRTAFRRIVAEPVAARWQPEPAPRRRRLAPGRRPEPGRDERPAARPQSALRVADMDGRGRNRGGAARGAATARALAAGRRVAEADCAAPGHAAPAPDCTAGSTRGTRAGARRAGCSAARGAIAGVVEAAGRSRSSRTASAPSAPAARVLAAGRSNARLLGRLAVAYRVPVVPEGDADAVLAWCRARSLGLEEAVVDELLGPEGVAAVRRARRTNRLRIAGVAFAIAIAIFLGLEFTADPGAPLFGRTGPVHGSP